MSESSSDESVPASPSSEATRVLEMLDGLPPFYEIGPAAARELQEAAAGWQERSSVFSVRDLVIPTPEIDVPARLYRPTADPELPLCLFFHGGGWMTGSLETHDALCRELALVSRAMVLAVEYRLAPEHPFPAGLVDCYRATVWAQEHLADLDAVSRLAVAGDSAGGNLAAAVALAARDRGGPEIQAQLIVYPVTDPSVSSDSFDLYDGLVVDRRAMEWYWEHYLGSSDRRTCPYAALRYASLERLPPALVITAECDPLRDEGEDFAFRLHEAGVHVSLLRCDGMIHDFVKMFSLLDAGRVALRQAGAFLRQYLMPNASA